MYDNNMMLAASYNALWTCLWPQRNVLFYVGVFGAVTAIARGMIPEEHLVFEPDATLREVIDHTHYMPPHWRGNFHSAEVHAEFGALYPLKVSIFFSELVSVILTPFILWLSLPRSAPAIIDFFKEVSCLVRFILDHSPDFSPLSVHCPRRWTGVRLLLCRFQL